MGLFDRFINTTRQLDAVSFDVVDTSQPVQLGRLAASIAAGFVAAIALGIQSLVSAVINLYVTAYDSLTSVFVGSPGGGRTGSQGILDALRNALAAVSSTTATPEGLLAFPIGIVVGIGALGVLVLALNTVRQEVL